MQINYDQAGKYWELTWQTTYLRLRLVDGMLRLELAGADSRGGLSDRPDIFRDPILATRAAASVQLAPDDRDVLWQLHDWSQPDGETFVLVLRATDLPLE